MFDEVILSVEGIERSADDVLMVSALLDDERVDAAAVALWEAQQAFLDAVLSAAFARHATGA